MTQNGVLYSEDPLQETIPYMVRDQYIELQDWILIVDYIVPM